MTSLHSASVQQEAPTETNENDTTVRPEPVEWGILFLRVAVIIIYWLGIAANLGYAMCLLYYWEFTAALILSTGTCAVLCLGHFYDNIASHLGIINERTKSLSHQSRNSHTHTKGATTYQASQQHLMTAIFQLLVREFATHALVDSFLLLAFASGSYSAHNPIMRSLLSVVTARALGLMAIELGLISIYWIASSLVVYIKVIWFLLTSLLIPILLLPMLLQRKKFEDFIPRVDVSTIVHRSHAASKVLLAMLIFNLSFFCLCCSIERGINFNPRATLLCALTMVCMLYYPLLLVIRYRFGKQSAVESSDGSSDKESDHSLLETESWPSLATHQSQREQSVATAHDTNSHSPLSGVRKFLNRANRHKHE